jgi:hypothetical protein
VSAFPDTGRSDSQSSSVLSGCLRPEADGGAGSNRQAELNKD